MDDSRLIDTDHALLVAARTDANAFGEFYRRHATWVERWIRTQTRDMVTAADLTAETFAQALTSLKRYRGTSDEAARGWLFGIARNLVRRYHRRGRVELATCRKLGIQLDHNPDELAQIEAQLDAGAQAAELARALNALPARSTRSPPATSRRRAGLQRSRRRDGHQRAEHSHPRIARSQNPLTATTRSLPMTSDSPLPAHLDRIGRQLTAAARQRTTSQPRARRRRAGALLGLPAAVAAAMVILLANVSTTSTPAYALTRHTDGSITITLNQLTTGIPALNAKLHALGIDETVIPISASCHSSDGSGPIVMRPDPMFEYTGSISTTYSPRYQQRHPAPEGFHYVLAAKRLPNGKILGFIGALKSPIPTCLPYSNTPSSFQP